MSDETKAALPRETAQVDGAGALAQTAQRKTRTRESKKAERARLVREAQIAEQEKFLDAYRKVATISGAAKHSGVGRRTHYDWLDADDSYEARFNAAREEATDALEQEARRRALVGIEETVYGRIERDKDGPIGVKRKYSDLLLITLLNANRPEKYRKRMELTGKDGGPIETKQVSAIDLTKLSPEQLDQLEAIQKAAGIKPAAAK